jgi:hypothetical protein
MYPYSCCVYLSYTFYYHALEVPSVLSTKYSFLLFLPRCNFNFWKCKCKGSVVCCCCRRVIKSTLYNTFEIITIKINIYIMTYYYLNIVTRCTTNADRRPPTNVLRYCVLSLIFYVGNSTTIICVSIISSVIVYCVMMRWKMNDHFTRTKFPNTIFST